MGLTLVLALAACATQPAYQAPGVSLPAAWQAPQPHSGEREQLADWWARFEDPVLSRLITLAEDDSPTLAQAIARIDGARAALSSSSAAASPALTGSASLSRARQTQQGAGSETTSSRSAGLDASWELDLFGKLRKSREAAQARIDARLDDWHDARVSLAAEVADVYVQFLSCRLLAQAYEAEAQSQTETGRVTLASIKAGFTASSEADLAEASAANANATAIVQRTECELLLKSLVALTGLDETGLRLMLGAQQPALKEPAGIKVVGVPSNLLRQRPDLAASERAVAAAYADIGQAEAGRYPSLTLSGTIALSASSLAASATSWSFGPSLVLPLLDGGKNKAALASAQATYDEALASYRSTVRSAVKEVEQALLNLDGAARRSEDALRAASAYRRYFESTEKNWRAGNINLLTLEEARRSAISAESALITLQRDRLRYWIALYKALGGGWSLDRETPVPATASPAPAGQKRTAPAAPVSDTQASLQPTIYMTQGVFQ
ncbi:MAG: efflux transporter outer membrane subunit [Pseudomonadota bacterium]